MDKDQYLSNFQEKMDLIDAFFRELDFAALMKNLMSSPDAQGKLRAAEELTKATTADHGFLAFHEYLKSTLSDEIEAIDLFSRIVLSRPRSYTDLQTYLLAMKTNFYEFAKSIIKEDLVFGSFTTKLFYSMRTNNLEGEFDFFYADFEDSWLCLVFYNLCSRNFYLDELNEVYIRNYKKILFKFDGHGNTEAVHCGLQKLELSFNFWLDVLSVPENQKLLDYLISIKHLPQATSEAIIFLSLFGLVSIDASELITSVESLSPDFSTALNDKINSGSKANEALVKALSQKLPILTHLLPVPKTWIEEVIDDLKSTEPAVLAHGLFVLRKQTDRKLLVENMREIADLCSNALFHEDTYVFMNAVKLFQELNNSSEVHSFASQVLGNFAASKLCSARFPRVVEVFSDWIERRAVTRSLLIKFLDACKLMIKSEDDECRISALNALNIVGTAYPSLVMQDYQAIFAQLRIENIESVTADLETQALFSFIDTFLTASSRGEVVVQTEIYASIDDLCRRALNSPDSSVKAMSLNNLMKLDQLKRF